PRDPEHEGTPVERPHRPQHVVPALGAGELRDRPADAIELDALLGPQPRAQQLDAPEVAGAASGRWGRGRTRHAGHPATVRRGRTNGNARPRQRPRHPLLRHPEAEPSREGRAPRCRGRSRSRQTDLTMTVTRHTLTESVSPKLWRTPCLRPSQRRPRRLLPEPPALLRCRPAPPVRGRASARSGAAAGAPSPSSP